MANFFSKALIGFNRIIDPEFNDFYKETFINKNQFPSQGASSSLNSAWDSSAPVPISLSEYGLGGFPQKDDTKNKHVEERKSFLTYEQMWEFYRYNSLIRACVDTKVKQITSLNWSILPKNFHILELNRLSKEQMDEKNYLEELLYNPNSLDESFASLLTKVLTDLLVYDAGIIKIIYDKKTKKPVGLEALHAPFIRFIVNKKRERIGFVNIKTREAYNEDEIIFLQYYGNTKSFYGTSPIESIMPELIGDIYSMLYNNKYFSENEIPDGLLYVGDLDQVNYDRMKAMFRAHKAKHFAIRMVSGKSEPKWINFKASNRDMQFAEMQDRLRKRIMTVYQINDTELGYTSEVNKSASEMQREIFNNKGLKPLIKLIEYHLNTEFVKKISKDFYFSFDKITELREWEEFRQLSTQTDLMKVQFYNLLYSEGKITLNEYRKLANSLLSISEIMDLKPVSFGGTHIVAGGYTSLENSLKLSERELKSNNIQKFKDKLGDSEISNIGLNDFLNYLGEIDTKESQKIKADILEDIVGGFAPKQKNITNDVEEPNNNSLPKANKPNITGRIKNPVAENKDKYSKRIPSVIQQDSKANNSQTTKKIKIKRNK